MSVRNLTLDQLARLRAHQLAGYPRRRLKRVLRSSLRSLRIAAGATATAAQLDEALDLLERHPERDAIEARAQLLLPAVIAANPRPETPAERVEREAHQRRELAERVLHCTTPVELCQAVGGSGLYDGGESPRFVDAVLRWAGEVTAEQASAQVEASDFDQGRREQDAEQLIYLAERAWWAAECSAALERCQSAGSERDEHRYMVCMVYRKSGLIVGKMHTRYFAERADAEDYFALLGDNRMSSYRQVLHDMGGDQAEVDDE